MPIKQTDSRIDQIITPKLKNLPSPYGDIAKQIYQILSKSDFTDEEFNKLIELFSAPSSLIELASEIRGLSKHERKLLAELTHMGKIPFNAVHDYNELWKDTINGKFSSPADTKNMIISNLISFAKTQGHEITENFAKQVYKQTSIYLYQYQQPAISINVLTGVLQKKLPQTENSIDQIINEIQKIDRKRLLKESPKKNNQVIVKAPKPSTTEPYPNGKTPPDLDPFSDINN